LSSPFSRPSSRRNMSSVKEIFQQYSLAVDTMRNAFADHGDELFANEILTQYDLTIQIADVLWLTEKLELLKKSLLPAQFELVLTVRVYDFQARFDIYLDEAILKDKDDNIETAQDSLTPEAFSIYDTFKKTCDQSQVRCQYADLYNLLQSLTDCEAKPVFSLQIFLNKNLANQKITGYASSSKVLSYLFPEALAALLEKISIENLEAKIFQAGKRTLLAVFGYSGYMEGDYLALCGKGHEEDFYRLISQPLAPDLIKKNSRIHELRQSQGIWSFPTIWITPEVFDFASEGAGEPVITERLHLQWKNIQSLLSILFLADRVDFQEEEYQTQFKGYSKQQFPVTRSLLLEQKGDLESIHMLYSYAYEGFSADKVEIVQQFLSLIATDLVTFWQKALEVRDAAKTTYDHSLAEKVEDYFEARHKIQERIRTVVSDTATSVIDLSKQVSDDLYKIAGTIALAVVGSLLKPDITLWAGLVAALGIAIYLSLVLFYHLRTLQSTYKLNMNQHKDYIESYKDILSEDEKKAFLSDQFMDEARRMYDDRSLWAKIFYSSLLMISIIVFIILLTRI
jgi:hypothetical protein